MALLYWEPRLAPGFDSPVHRDDIGIAHLLYAVRRQSRSITAAAIQYDRLLLIRNDLFDIPLDDTLAEVHRSCGMVLRIFAILADIDKVKSFAAIKSGLYVRD